MDGYVSGNQELTDSIRKARGMKLVGIKIMLDYGQHLTLVLPEDEVQAILRTFDKTPLIGGTAPAVPQFEHAAVTWRCETKHIIAIHTFDSNEYFQVAKVQKKVQEIQLAQMGIQQEGAVGTYPASRSGL